MPFLGLAGCEVDTTMFLPCQIAPPLIVASSSVAASIVRLPPERMLTVPPSSGDSAAQLEARFLDHLFQRG